MLHIYNYIYSLYIYSIYMYIHRVFYIYTIVVIYTVIYTVIGFSTVICAFTNYFPLLFLVFLSACHKETIS